MSAPRLDLNALEDEARKLVTLLEHREPGLFTWHCFLRDRLQAIRALTNGLGLEGGR